MNVRKRKKFDLSTRRLSFNTNIPDTPTAKATSNETPGTSKNQTENKKRRSANNGKLPRVRTSLSKSQAGKKNYLNKTNQSRNNSTIQEDPLFEIHDLLKKRWKIYRVSPLYKFQESKLKIYGKKLCQELCSISNKFDDDTSFSSLTATFSVAEGFNPLLDDSYALQVKLKTNNNKNNYTGYFITCENKKEDENFTSLPILLAQGNKGMLNLVHKSICKLFDCDIQQMELSTRVLIIHLAKYLEAVKDNAEDTAVFSLQYRLPGFNQKNSVTVTLSVLDMVAAFLTLLNQIPEGRNGDLMRNEFLERSLYEKLLFHIFKVYQLNLMRAELFKTVLPQAILTSEGEVKWTTNSMVMLGLTLLQEFSYLE